MQCHSPITGVYFEAAGKVVCAGCKQKIEAALMQRDERASVVRASAYGLGGAVAGAALYYAVLAATGYEIGLIAILVGYMVGYTVRRGAGMGARRFQVLALALTYLAIGSTYVPLVLRENPGKSNAGPDSTASARAPASGSSSGRALALGVGALALLTVAMPIAVVVGNLPSSLISLLIIGFALRQAWRMNTPFRVTFTGPFELGAGGQGASGG